jgi:hypothetical protein
MTDFMLMKNNDNARRSARDAQVVLINQTFLSASSAQSADNTSFLAASDDRHRRDLVIRGQDSGLEAVGVGF